MRCTCKCVYFLVTLAALGNMIWIPDELFQCELSFQYQVFDDLDSLSAQAGHSHKKQNDCICNNTV